MYRDEKGPLDLYLSSKNRKLVLWIEKNMQNTDLIEKLKEEEFYEIPIRSAHQHTFFQRNDTSTRRSSELSYTMIILPVLQVELEEDNMPGHWHVGYIEGKSNILSFLNAIKLYERGIKIE